MTGWNADRLDRRDFDAVLAPVAEAAGLPNAAYVSADYVGMERDHLLGRTWTAIGVGAEVPDPGAVKPVLLYDLPLLLVRDLEGKVRVFHNVCSHRGLQLVAEPGRAKGVLRCPYHSWTYGLDGTLRATPGIGGPGVNDCAGFRRDGRGLKAVRCAQWADVVFVDLGGAAGDFADFIGPLADRWAAFDLDQLRHGGADSRFELSLACNWKLAVDNYCEAYHLPWVHPSLNSYSRLEDHYNIAVEDRFSGQGTRVYAPRLAGGDGQAAFPEFAGLPPQWQQGAEYIALYPNVLFGIHRDHFYAVVVLPLAPDRVKEKFEIYYVGAAATAADLAGLRDANRRQWRQVFEEDRGVVEGMQRGRASPAFQGGAFSPVMDGPTHCFHAWVARRIGNALGRNES